MTTREISVTKRQTLKRPESLFLNSKLNNPILEKCRQSSTYTTYSHKSIKCKLLSIFKNNKLNNPIDGINLEKTKIQSKNPSNLPSTLLNETPKSNTNVQSKTVKEIPLNTGDKELIDKVKLHPIIKYIINCINNNSCSMIRVPPQWIEKIGRDLSNNVLRPLLSFTPGLIGLENHGNTCYVNVIIQCLAHLDSVAEFFSTKDYISHINHKEDQTGDKSEVSKASCLDLTIGFAYLIQSLWQNTYSGNISLKFCHLITTFKNDYILDTQQDAHEFLLCLLNLLHDSLAIPNTKLVPKGNPKSFIESKFKLMISNELVCCECKSNKQSPPLEMFSLDLQIPKKFNFVEKVYHLMVINSCQNVVKHAIKVTSTTTVKDIRNVLSKRLQCDSQDILLLELNDNGFGKIFMNSENMLNVFHHVKYKERGISDGFGNGLYGVYIRSQVIDVDASPVSTVTNVNDEINKKNDSYLTCSFVRLLVVHVEKGRESLVYTNEEMKRRSLLGRTSMKDDIIRTYYTRFTRVMTVQASRKTRLDFLRRALTDQMLKSLNIKNYTKLPIPQIVVEGSFLLTDNDPYPLNHPVINDHLKINVDICNNGDATFLNQPSSFITLTVVWPTNTTNQLRQNKLMGLEEIQNNKLVPLNKPKISIHSSVDELSSKHRENNKTNNANRNTDIIYLKDCLDDYFTTDSVDSNIESWHCFNCQTKRSAKSKLRVTKAPEILVLLLKRFRKNPSQNNDTKAINNKNNLNDNNIKSYCNGGGCDNKNQITKTTSLQNSYADYNNEQYHNDIVSETYHNPHLNHHNKKSIVQQPPTPAQVSATVVNNDEQSSSRASSNDDNYDKLECHVEYPLEDLNFSPYMDKSEDNGDCIYDLVGVVNHKGTMSNGHYTSICRNSVDNNWWRFDDENVTHITKPSDIVNCNAYVLFYQRRKIAQTLPNHASSSPDTNSMIRSILDIENIHWSLRRLSFPDGLHQNQTQTPMAKKTPPNPPLIPNKKLPLKSESSTTSSNQIASGGATSSSSSITRGKGGGGGGGGGGERVNSPLFGTSATTVKPKSYKETKRSIMKSNNFHQTELSSPESICSNNMSPNESLLQPTSSSSLNNSPIKSNDSGTVLSNEHVDFQTFMLNRKPKTGRIIKLTCDTDIPIDECYNSQSTSPVSQPSLNNKFIK